VTTATSPPRTPYRLGRRALTRRHHDPPPLASYAATHDLTIPTRFFSPPPQPPHPMLCYFDDPSLYSLLSTPLFGTALRHPVALLAPLDDALHHVLPTSRRTCRSLDFTWHVDALRLTPRASWRGDRGTDLRAERGWASPEGHLGNGGRPARTQPPDIPVSSAQRFSSGFRSVAWVA